MKLIKPSFEIIEQPPGLDGIFKMIEIAGRTCYKSEDKITEDSAKKFVQMLIDKNHTAMLEHGTVYLYSLNSDNKLKHYAFNPYSTYKDIYSHKEVCQGDVDYYSHEYVTTNYRVLYENGWLDDLKYLCEPTEHHAKRVTVKFNTDIGITREANRHRVNSMAEQSTRYCNYSKDRFGNRITVALNEDINPEEYTEALNRWSRGDIKSPRSAFRTMCGAIYNFCEDSFSAIELWIFGNASCEFTYMELIKRGWTPQQARRVLPLDLHSELVHTAFVGNWDHFFDLRARGKYIDSKGREWNSYPHPDMKALAVPLLEEFIKRGYLND